MWARQEAGWTQKHAACEQQQKLTGMKHWLQAGSSNSVEEQQQCLLGIEHRTQAGSSTRLLDLSKLEVMSNKLAKKQKQNNNDPTKTK